MQEVQWAGQEVGEGVQGRGWVASGGSVEGGVEPAVRGRARPVLGREGGGARGMAVQGAAVTGGVVGVLSTAM